MGWRRAAALGAAAGALAAAGCGAQQQTEGRSTPFLAAANTACARSIDPIGILDLTQLPDNRRFEEIATGLDGGAAALRSIQAPSARELRDRDRLADRFAAGAAAVRGFVASDRSGAGDLEQRYDTMLRALGDIGDAAARTGASGCNLPLEE